MTVYGAIRSYTEENGDCIRPPCTKTVNDRFFLRISPYGSVYDMEIYDRNTITCKPSYFSVYDRLQPCLFNLGKGETSVLRIRSYTIAVYGRIAPSVIAYGRTRLSQLYNLMNSKYFNLI